ncbi:MAG: DNA-binding protein [Candidatus Odinarchaeia archaeon]
MSDDELEAIKKKKLLELQKRLYEEENKELERLEYERKKEEILRRLLSPAARSRLTNIKMVKPQLAEQIETQLIALAQTGQLARAGIRTPLSDEQLKDILKKLQSKRRDINIRFK